MKYDIGKTKLDEINSQLKTYAIFIDNHPAEIVVTTVSNEDEIKRDAAYHGRYIAYLEIDERITIKK
ncbi:hypothetical protein [Piscirickettsia litoralis]|uniref:Uncharacterized protein n=1 Tax=Piscirickettsia litoralis TaxID=1891921 RepID=A0ABX2ZX95_9GAMM|nr:hypothetical protein [Piscirickettsia litoralis]ODN41004.1 hypothetical protein BGC07_18400 [Piscirickettsia litoralis]